MCNEHFQWKFSFSFSGFFPVLFLQVKDRTQLRCHTPEPAHGKLWEVQCYNDWYLTERKMNPIEKIWTITMVVLINVTIIYCAISGLKRWIRYRKKIEEERQRQENLETTRELYV